MKKFENPEMNIEKLETEDVITTSSDSTKPSEPDIGQGGTEWA